ncbi:carotenoid biosynthesis protein [Segetibacter koreensis]|uniref:carotenoid biosynthesis protein n=1 Tax=Segetibacter koreensis TaxID=398037 RepID=UPI000375E140|nr:carotenoid biosynthesis protein [Segetibacter koreensis]
MKKWKINRFTVATFIAILFHVSGFIGMFTSKSNWFVDNTPLNLLIMFALILWTDKGKNASFLAFFLICFAVGMLTEIIGVNTSLLFGEYEYGKVLGTGILDVPWLIGINWFTVMYCSGVVIAHLHRQIEQKSSAAEILLTPRVKLLSFIFDGALLATFFDFVLEPVAIKLGYWKWLGSGSIPFSNYLCWFLISSLLLTVFKLLSFPKHNQFAVHLLIIELLFFGALRTFL